MAPNAPIRTRLGVYPGSFDPPTIAHVHLAEQAIEQCGLDRLDLVISVVTLGKSDDRLSPLADRLAELHRLADTNPAIGVRTTTHSLLADIATGYDVVVMGADKWAQVLDPQWYGGIEARNKALRRLPKIALAPRPPWPMPGDDPVATVPDGLEVVILDVDETHGPVSATEVRAGRTEWRALPPQ
jgi:nicotinic acid mononucleotide adenylyltransferase